jgi:hypothetical protein
MENQIIDVEYEDGIISIAKIIKGHGSEYDIATLRYYGDDEWNFDMEELETISKDSVSGFYDTTKLENTGLYEKLINGMYVEVDESDFEYEVASSEDDESESDISLDDEDF